MGDARQKKERPLLPPPPTRPQLVERTRPSLPSALAKLVPRPSPSHLAAQQFDKAFAVTVHTARGVQTGVGRNISAEGMFVEAKEVPPMGTEVRITFAAPEVDTKLTVVGLVKFVATLQVVDGDGGAGLRGFGLRFTAFEDDGLASGATAH